MNSSISFICGDNRQIFLENLFNSNGFKTYVYDLSSPLLSESCTKCASLDIAISKSKYIVFPFRIDCISLFQIESILPLLENKIVFGGCISNEIQHLFNLNHIEFFDYFKSDYVNKLNAVATAEGCIYYAIGNSLTNIHGSKSLIIGCGNCGYILATKLISLGSLVTVTTRSPYQKAYAYANLLNSIDINELPNTIYDYTYIFNTVPSMIIDKNILSNMNKDSIIIDIASSPL